MRNLKKLLAVITVVAIMATLFVIPASAASLSDVAGTAYESAVTRLNALGVITGREDGKFYPNDTITRAEFAAVVIRSLGYGTAADAAKGQTKFSDVKADFWASGYINLASSLGIIKGRPDGTFGANDKVLYEEAVTMVVRSLGYEPAASANGGYPTGYLTIASQEDIDDGAVAAVGAPASRGLVAQLVDNSLEVAMMIQTGYGTEQKFVKSGTEGTTKQTILDSKLKLDKYKVNVKSVDLADKEMKVQITTDTDNPADKRGDIETYSVFDGISFVGLENANITVWVKDSKIYNIKNDTTVVYDFIKKINGDDNTTDLNTTYGAITDITLRNSGVTYDTFENTAGNIDYDLNIDNAAAAMGTDADALIGKFAKVFVESGKITRVEAYTPAAGDVGLITKVDPTYLEITRGVTEEKKIRDLDDADSILVVIDGKAATLADLKADMSLIYWKAAGSDDYVFVASSKQIKGTLNSAKDSKLTINGVSTDSEGLNNTYYSKDNGGEYKILGSVEDYGKLVGANVTAYVDGKGKISYVKGDVTEATTTFYGIVTAKDSVRDELKVAKKVDNEVKEVLYATDLRDTTSGTDMAFADVNDVATLGGTLNADRLDSFYKFTINSDNVITKVEDVHTAADTIADAKFNSDGLSIDNNDSVAAATARIYPDGATIFEISADGDIKTYNWLDIKGSAVTVAGSNVAVYYTDNDVTPGFVLLDDAGAVAFSNTSYTFALVTSKVKIAGDDYEYKVVNNDGEKTFVVDKDELAASAEDSFIAYRTVSGDANRIEVVAKSAYDNLAAVAAMSTNWAQVSNAWVDQDSVKISDGTFKVGGTAYDLDSNAVIYKVSGNSMGDFTAADLSDIDATTGTTTKVSFVMYKGRVRYMFYWEP